MIDLYNLFDSFNGIVYVSDIDTYELVYLNKKGLKRYGFSTAQDFSGKKCYEVLQGCIKPCAVCNNKHLSPGNWVKWSYYSPLLSEKMILFDTMLLAGRRRYRLEIAIGIERIKFSGQKDNQQSNMEQIVNLAIGSAVQMPTPDLSINSLLEFIGLLLKGDRTYIFEKKVDFSIDNTYEWVAFGVKAEKDNLQNLPLDTWITWYQEFQKKQSVIIEHIEDICKINSIQYNLLKQQNITSIIVIPLYNGDENIGFLGIDNPRVASKEYALSLLHIMAHFIEAAIKRRNLVRQLQDMSFHDQLTGVGNRYALRDFVEKLVGTKSLGILFCDIIGLKKVNDTMGHKFGDELIIRCANCMLQSLNKAHCYRFGGDELVACCPDVTENELVQMVEKLKAVLLENNVTMSIGSAFASAGSINIDQLMSEAEARMYEDKRMYYQMSGADRRKC